MINGGKHLCENALHLLFLYTLYELRLMGHITYINSILSLICNWPSELFVPVPSEILARTNVELFTSVVYIIFPIANKENNKKTVDFAFYF